MVAQDASAPAAGQGTEQGPPQGGRRNPAEMEQRRLEMMTKQLGLTPDQVTQVKGIMDAQRQEMMANRSSSASPEDRRAQMMAARDATQGKIRAVLTEEQKPKFDAMEAKMKARMQERNGGQDGPPPPPPSGL